MTTDGFWVLSRPPAVGMVTVAAATTLADAFELRVHFQPFVHDYGRFSNQADAMDFYEWSVAEEGPEGALLSPWSRIDGLVATDQGMVSSCDIGNKPNLGCQPKVSSQSRLSSIYSQSGQMQQASNEVW